MSKKIGVVMFAIGAISGSLVTWQVLKRKYEQLVQEEIQSVKDAFKKQFGGEENKPVEESTPKVDPEDVKKYTQIIAEEKYNTQEDEQYESVEEETVKEFSYGNPFVITPEEFDEEGYSIVCLTYYADGKLANDQGQLVDIETVGQDAIDRIGEYDDDCIHVRNIPLETDFEVLLDPRKYSEVYKNRG